MPPQPLGEPCDRRTVDEPNCAPEWFRGRSLGVPPVPDRQSHWGNEGRQIPVRARHVFDGHESTWTLSFGRAPPTGAVTDGVARTAREIGTEAAQWVEDRSPSAAARDWGPRSAPCPNGFCDRSWLTEFSRPLFEKLSAPCQLQPSRPTARWDAFRGSPVRHGYVGERSGEASQMPDPSDGRTIDSTGLSPLWNP